MILIRSFVMSFSVGFIARALLIFIATVGLIYLLFTTFPDGDAVDINERWRIYGEPSYPVQVGSNENPLAFDLLSPAEKDESGNTFNWITEGGDLLTVTNLSAGETSGVLKFTLSPNPCNFKRDILFGTDLGQKKFSVESKFPRTYTLKISLLPGESKFFPILALPDISCKVNNGDTRRFVGKISDISINSV